MEKILLRILGKLPQSLIIYLGKKYPGLFFDNERITRVIYSPLNVNPKTLSLKSNFFKFKHNPKSGKNELSCVRFDFTTLDFCREHGVHYEDPTYNRNYFGIACTKANYIKKLNGFDIYYTPILDQDPINPFHCDVYNFHLQAGKEGVALPASANFAIEEFKSMWKAYEDKDLQHDQVLPLSIPA